MKNLNHLTFEELVRYLDLTATDPGTRRLVEMLYGGSTSVFSELVDEGMNPTDGYFHTDYETFTPGEYIRYLRNEIDYYSDEVDEKQQEVLEAEERIEALEEKIKVWTILER